MEIELKYAIDDRSVVDKIFNDSIVTDIMDLNSDETIDMHAVYFDTPDMELSRNSMAFRIRREGSKLMATLKWGGYSEGEMHKREEINIPVDDEGQLENPDMTIFEETEAGPVLEKIANNGKMVPLMVIDFLRKQVRLDTGKAICELSIDEGSVKCNGKEDRILEMEIELYSGLEEEIIRLGNELSEKYNLKPGEISKFRRGLNLLD